MNLWIVTTEGSPEIQVFTSPADASRAACLMEGNQTIRKYIPDPSREQE